MTEQEAVVLMCWKGAWLFDRWMPPMKAFLPNAYRGWYDRLINQVLPDAGEEAMAAFIDAGLIPLTFYQRHAKAERET